MGFGSKVLLMKGIFSVLPAVKMGREPKKMERGGLGRGRVEMLANKPLVFENRPFDLSQLSALIKVTSVKFTHEK